MEEIQQVVNFANGHLPFYPGLPTLVNTSYNPCSKWFIDVLPLKFAISIMPLFIISIALIVKLKLRSYQGPISATT